MDLDVLLMRNIYINIYIYTRLEFKRLDEQKCWRMFELARVG